MKETAFEIAQRIADRDMECAKQAAYDERPLHPDVNVEVKILAEDARYPTLLLSGDFGNVGYALNMNTGELRRICICAARSSSECCCGAWEDS